MTLDRAAVCLRGCVAPGQAYVALSRAKTLEGLRVTGYSRGCVRVSKEALAFMDDPATWNPGAWATMQRAHPCAPPVPRVISAATAATRTGCYRCGGAHFPCSHV